MKRSSLNAYRRARLVVLCFVALSILFMVSSSKPWAAGKLTPDEAGSQSITAELKNNLPLKSLAAATGKYTLNQYVFPGSTTFTSLSPTLVPSPPPQITSWSIGVPILYVITIGNSDPTQTTPVDITLKDDLASSLGSNFVVLNVKCDAATANGAACPAATTLPQANAPLSFTIPHLMIKVGSSNDLVIRVLGYYTGPNSYQNTFSVFETGKQSTTEEVGPSKNVQITTNWSLIDLKLTKTASTTSTSLSATTAATIHYTLTLSGDSAQDFYPGNALRIEDRMMSSYPPLPSYSISNFTCTSVNGSTCPAPPSPLGPGASPSGSNSYAYTYLIWPAGSSTVIKKGDVITLKFDLDVKLASDCGSSSISIQNLAAITMSGFTYGDANNANNSANTPANSFTTGLTKICQPPPPVAGTIAKKRVCPTSVCPVVNWGDTVTYQIDVKNNLSAAQKFQVKDYVSKQSITVPLKATLSPNSVPADVVCSPGTIVCTTTPATTVPPQNVLFDAQNYQLFQTDFTLQPAGTPGDGVSLTFNVRIDKLVDCETDTGNVFDNTAQLWEVISQGNLSATSFVAWSSTVSVQLPNLPACQMKVTKTLDQPTNGITFGQPVSYTITYENLNNQPITVRTLRDALNMRDLVNASPYGNIPITNLSASCTTTIGVSPMPIYQLAYTQIFPSGPDWQGSVVIQEPSGGMTFPASSKLQCTVSFVPHEPSATDNYCKGSGKPEIVNSAFMDISGLYYYGVKPSTPFFAQVTAPLPLCRKVSVLKSVANGVSSTGPNGLLTFQIDVTNYGNDPVSNFHLSDPLPSGFNYVANSLVCAPASACTGPPGFSGNTLNQDFNTIPGTSAAPNNTVTLTFKVNAPLAGGTYPNTAIGSFGPGPAGTNFYFEGDPAVLLVNSAQVQVLTPTLIKSFAPSGIALSGSAILTFTITNQTSDPAQSGIAFTDLLPSGVTVTSAPATACGGAVSVSGGNSIALANGSLAQGQHQCQFSVNVKASSCGKFLNDKSNFSKVSNLDVTNAQSTLEVTGCTDDGTPSCGVKADEISCQTDGTGGYLYSFTVTNNTGRVVTDVMLTPKSNSGIIINPQQPKLPIGGLAIGASFTGTATISGGKPGERACFTITLMTQDGECCTTEVCPVLPDCCGIAKDESIECNGDGTYTYAVSIVNTGPNTIEHIYLNPQAGSTMSQTYFAVSLKPGEAFTAKVIIKGARPGRYCFGISLHTAGMKDCCSGEKCLTLPECPIRNSP